MYGLGAWVQPVQKLAWAWHARNYRLSHADRKQRNEGQLLVEFPCHPAMPPRWHEPGQASRNHPTIEQGLPILCFRAGNCRSRCAGVNAESSDHHGGKKTTQSCCAACSLPCSRYRRMEGGSGDPGNFRSLLTFAALLDRALVTMAFSVVLLLDQVAAYTTSFKSPISGRRIHFEERSARGS